MPYTILPEEPTASAPKGKFRIIEDASEPAAVQAGRGLMEIPRQLGLTARHAMEGAGAAITPIVEPLRLPLSMAARGLGYNRPIMNPEELMRASADNLGLPSPETADERVVGDATRLMTGAGATSKIADLASKTLTSPTAQKVATAAAQNVGQQIAAGAGAGAAGGAVREAGGGSGAQFAASLAGGLGGAGGAGIANKAVNLYESLTNSIKGALRPNPTNAEVTLTLTNALKPNGIEFGQLPGLVQAKLADEVKQSLKLGRPLNEDVIRRIADYSLVGATPTRGTVTQNPNLITQEENTRRIGANSSSPALQEMANMKNANNKALIESVNGLGVGDMRAGGAAAMDAVQARNAGALGVRKGLYDQARDSTGRALDLDREGFIQQAYNNLAQSNKGAFLPSEIQTLIKQIRTGEAVLDDGTKIPFPFNADVIDNLKTTLATAARGAKDGNTKAAISDVYKALDATKPRVQGAQVGGNQLVNPAAMQGAQAGANAEAGQAMAAFDRARGYARRLFNWQESAPGISGAIDGANPETFVKDFIIGNTNKGQTAHVEALMHTVRRDPEAATAVKGAVVSWLKEQAGVGAKTGGDDALGHFSGPGLNKALDQLGDGKLRLFFSKDEIAQLKAAGRVGAYETAQPRGSAVNNSNSAAAVVGFLEKLANTPYINKIPYAGPLSQELVARLSTNTAKDVMPTVMRQATKDTVPLSELLVPPVVMGGLLASPGSQGRENDKRR